VNVYGVFGVNPVKVIYVGVVEKNELPVTIEIPEMDEALVAI
jgi:hypothetical protein